MPHVQSTHNHRRSSVLPNFSAPLVRKIFLAGISYTRYKHHLEIMPPCVHREGIFVLPHSLSSHLARRGHRGRMLRQRSRPHVPSTRPLFSFSLLSLFLSCCCSYCSCSCSSCSAGQLCSARQYLSLLDLENSQLLRIGRRQIHARTLELEEAKDTTDEEKWNNGNVDECCFAKKHETSKK